VILPVRRLVDGEQTTAVSILMACQVLVAPADLASVGRMILHYREIPRGSGGRVPTCRPLLARSEAATRPGTPRLVGSHSARTDSASSARPLVAWLSSSLPVITRPTQDRPWRDVDVHRGRRQLPWVGDWVMHPWRKSWSPCLEGRVKPTHSLALVAPTVDHEWRPGHPPPRRTIGSTGAADGVGFKW
jgi:hypothetical protein